jgi:hypothetical protein
MALQQRNQYLKRAREAESFAAKAVDISVKQGWERIAEGYRALAKLAPK